ncbi:MAG TPA: MBL fold metallo-hydrolase [Syntrophomonadaceae bacterium]|nr:MBL fold metallo-hydrolase [Syntrophomonadaceae bacterium]
MLEKINNYITMVFTEDGFTYSNCVLVDDDIRVLIDSGAGSIMPQVYPEHIDMVLNSHHHIDHVRGNNLCTEAKILMHPLEQASMDSLEELTATTGWEELMNDGGMLGSAAMSGLIEELGGPWRIDGTINDGDVIDCGHTEIMVMHTPGHSKGHCSFYFPEQELFFLGDICLSKVGPWYGNETCSIEEFIDSINRIIALRPRMVTAGHVNRVITTDVKQTLLEYRDRILKREQRILRYLQTHSSNIDELAQQHLIYRQHPTPFVLFWEKYMIKKHLERLVDIGYVEPLDDGSFQGIKIG